MDVTRINMLHKMWCNIQKNDHMMATFMHMVKSCCFYHYIIVCHMSYVWAAFQIFFTVFAEDLMHIKGVVLM
jgi:hypothetical protein